MVFKRVNGKCQIDRLVLVFCFCWSGDNAVSLKEVCPQGFLLMHVWPSVLRQGK